MGSKWGELQEKEIKEENVTDYKVTKKLLDVIERKEKCGFQIL